MNREGALGIILIALLLGGIVLFARRPALTASLETIPLQTHNPGIKVVPVSAEPQRYQNKEIRQIEYNEDNLPIKIVITRDYAIT